MVINLWRACHHTSVIPELLHSVLNIQCSGNNSIGVVLPRIYFCHGVVQLIRGIIGKEILTRVVFSYRL